VHVPKKGTPVGDHRDDRGPRRLVPSRRCLGGRDDQGQASGSRSRSARRVARRTSRDGPAPQVEAVVPEIPDYTFLIGLFAAGKTPREIVGHSSRPRSSKVMASPEMRSASPRSAPRRVTMSPAQFDD
jgi:hypothetical protein